VSFKPNGKAYKSSRYEEFKKNSVTQCLYLFTFQFFESVALAGEYRHQPARFLHSNMYLIGGFFILKLKQYLG
jgi:hypothetical protein